MHELFGYMELSVLAIVTGEPSINLFSYQPWEGISPREDVESVSLCVHPFSFVDAKSL